MIVPEDRGRLYDRMLNDIASIRLPKGRSRSNPRVVKREMSKFPLKREEDHTALKPSGPLRDAVALLSQESIVAYLMSIDLKPIVIDSTMA